MIGIILNNKYQLQKLVAESTGFEIYLAVEAETGTEVVVKIMSEDIAKNEERVSAFSGEVKRFTCLSHPALAHILDFDAWEGRPYLVTEHIEGQDVRSAIKTASLTFEEIIRVVTEVGEVIYHAYDQGITPRYLKQSNIFRSMQGRTRILSFSLPRLKLVGSNENDAQAGVQSDLFFLGTLMYELLTGESPIRRRGGINELWDNKLMQAMRLKFEHLAPALIEKIVAIIDKTFTREVKLRYTDHLGFLRDLRELGKAGRDRSAVAASSAPLRRPPMATASEVVDAIHGRLPGRATIPAMEGAVAGGVLCRLPTTADRPVGSEKSESAGFADMMGFSQPTDTQGNAVLQPLADLSVFPEGKSERPALKMLKGGRSSRANTIWKGTDEHAWYRHPLLMMGAGIAFMIVLILFW